MTLYELTGQESGIIVYEDGSAAVGNWAALEDDCLPMFFEGGFVSYPMEPGFFDGSAKDRTDDWRSFFPDEELKEDGGPASVYRLRSGHIVLAPDDWN